MRTITRTFDTLRLAERYQNRLYSQYASVRLVRSPMFGESGTYAWQVKP